MTVKFANNAVGTLASSITAGETTIVVGGGEGDLFPDLAAEEFFFVTLVDADGNREIVNVTGRSSNTMTVTRAQEGTVARDFAAGSKISLRVTAAGLSEFPQLNKANTYSKPQTFQDGVELTKGAEDVAAVLNADAGQKRSVHFRTGGLDRWQLGASDDAEAGDGSGSDFKLSRFGDDGVVIDTPFRVDRKTGQTYHGANKADSFPSGTRMLFQQTAAPTGWTKVTTHDNKALRIVSGAVGSGGVTPFTTVFKNRVIAQDNLPNVTLSLTTSLDGHHNHNIPNITGAASGLGGGGAPAGSWNGGTTKTGDAGNHTHTGTTSSINGGVTQQAMDFAVQYVDVIIAQKD